MVIDINILSNLVVFSQVKERRKKGLFKGLYAEKRGEVIITNGAEVPTKKAVEFLLFLVKKSAESGWNDELRWDSISSLLTEFFGSRGGEYFKRLVRYLITWKNHSFYFKNSFIVERNKVVSKYFGVIDEFVIEEEKEGKRAIVIKLSPSFISVLKNSNWYRNVSFSSFKNLRKDTSRALYLYLFSFFSFKREEEKGSWKVYLPKELKGWYREVFSSSVKEIRPSVIIKRIEEALKEITEKTELTASLSKEKEGNYSIIVKIKEDKLKENERKGKRIEKREKEEREEREKKEERRKSKEEGNFLSALKKATKKTKYNILRRSIAKIFEVENEVKVLIRDRYCYEYLKKDLSLLREIEGKIGKRVRLILKP